MKEEDERRKLFHCTPLTQTATAPENLVRFCSRELSWSSHCVVITD
jgi:hypothetical protein